MIEKKYQRKRLTKLNSKIHHWGLSVYKLIFAMIGLSQIAIAYFSKNEFHNFTCLQCFQLKPNQSYKDITLVTSISNLILAKHQS